MKKVIDTYTQNQHAIRRFIQEIAAASKISDLNQETAGYCFSTNKSSELIYRVNSSFQQTTFSYGRDYVDEGRMGLDKSSYFKLLDFSHENIHISNPYIHYDTGLPALTLVKKEGNDFLVVDFDLLTVLEELNLIEYNKNFEKVNALVMSVGGIILGMVAIFLILYGAWLFMCIVFSNGEAKDTMHGIFSSVISITVGIAIYDLAKTLCENEILYKKFARENGAQNKTLIKFLTSIIIALSIESLLAVFKIILEDPHNMINAFYLISSITMLIVGTGIYNFLSNKSK